MQKQGKNKEKIQPAEPRIHDIIAIASRMYQRCREQFSDF